MCCSAHALYVTVFDCEMLGWILERCYYSAKTGFCWKQDLHTFHLNRYLPSPPLSTVFEESFFRWDFSVLISCILCEEFWILWALSWWVGVLFRMVCSRLGFGSRQTIYYRHSSQNLTKDMHVFLEVPLITAEELDAE